jgi:hypothetical protein
VVDIVEVKTEESKLRGLRRFNAAMFFLHFLQAIAILVITYVVIGEDVTLPVRSYVVPNPDPLTLALTESVQPLVTLRLAP